MRQQCLMTSKLKKIAFSAVCKINQHNQWVVCEGKSCVKTCSRCYCGLPGGSSGDHFFIWYLDYHDFHGHHHHRQHNHYSLHDHHDISSSATCKRWTASLPRTTARSSSPFPSTSSRNSALPNKPRERCVFFWSARTSCTAFDWPVRGQEFFLSPSSLPQNYGLHGSQVGLTCQVHLV